MTLVSGSLLLQRYRQPQQKHFVGSQELFSGVWISAWAALPPQSNHVIYLCGTQGVSISPWRSVQWSLVSALDTQPTVMGWVSFPEFSVSHALYWNLNSHSWMWSIQKSLRPETEPRLQPLVLKRQRLKLLTWIGETQAEAGEDWTNATKTCAAQSKHLTQLRKHAHQQTVQPVTKSEQKVLLLAAPVVTTLRALSDSPGCKFVLTEPASINSAWCSLIFHHYPMPLISIHALQTLVCKNLKTEVALLKCNFLNMW